MQDVRTDMGKTSYPETPSAKKKVGIKSTTPVTLLYCYTCWLLNFIKSRLKGHAEVVDF